MSEFIFHTLKFIFITLKLIFRILKFGAGILNFDLRKFGSFFCVRFRAFCAHLRIGCQTLIRTLIRTRGSYDPAEVKFPYEGRKEALIRVL